MSYVTEDKESNAKQTRGRFDLALRLLMKTFALSQKEVADASGVSMSFVNDLFHGRKQQLSIKLADQISAAFPDTRINGTALFILADLSNNPFIKEIRRHTIERLELLDMD